MVRTRLVVTALALYPVVLAAAEPATAAVLRLPGAEEGNVGQVWVGFDPAGRYLAAYHIPDKEKARLTVWDAVLGTAVHDWAVGFVDGTPPAVGGPAAFLPSGSHLMYLLSNGLGGQPLGAARGEIKVYSPLGQDASRFSPTGLWAGRELVRVTLNKDRTGVAVDRTSSERPGEFAGRRQYHLGGPASAMALSPDQARLAWAEDPPDLDQVVTVHVLDLGTGKGAAFKTASPANRLSRLAFSPDGKRLAAGGEDGVVRLWDVAAGKETGLARGPLFSVSTLAYRPDGAVLAYGTLESNGGGNVWVVSANDGAHLATWAAGRRGVFCVAFHPKGDRLAVVGGEGVVKVYDMKQVLKK